MKTIQGEKGNKGTHTYINFGTYTIYFTQEDLFHLLAGLSLDERIWQPDEIKTKGVYIKAGVDLIFKLDKK